VDGRDKRSHDGSSVMSPFANELIASLKQAAAHAKGRKVRGMRVTTVEMPDVKSRSPHGATCPP
jgi:hypothetical protein